jgi:hypothetical protein
MTKAIREKAAALRVTLTFSLAHIGERVDFIPVPHFHFAPAKASGSEEGFTQSENSNNPLAVELESENDIPAKIFDQRFPNFTSVEAAASARQRRISSNDQHVKTLGAACNHHIHGSDAGTRKRK